MSRAVRVQPKTKFWCFTENDDPEAFRARLHEVYTLPDGRITYICGQIEQGTHLHFQGYVQLARSQALTYVRNRISGTAHWELQRGSNDQARRYCTPDKEESADTIIPGTFIEFGDFIGGHPGRGARNDIHALRDAIMEGSTQREIIKSDELVPTYATNMRFADRVRSLFPPPPRDDPTPLEVHLYYGPPGTGKTRKAFTDHPTIYEIPVSNGTIWLDGYDDHDAVLFDDFMGKGSKLGLDNTLKFLDRYTRQVPIKGAHVWFRPVKIVVTSNYHPRYWYDWTNREESWGALTRRFHQVWVFHLDEEPELQDSVEDFFNDVDLWPPVMLPPIGGDGVTYFK